MAFVRTSLLPQRVTGSAPSSDRACEYMHTQDKNQHTQVVTSSSCDSRGSSSSLPPTQHAWSTPSRRTVCRLCLLLRPAQCDSRSCYWSDRPSHPSTSHIALPWGAPWHPRGLLAVSLRAALEHVVGLSCAWAHHLHRRHPRRRPQQRAFSCCIFAVLSNRTERNVSSSSISPCCSSAVSSSSARRGLV